MERYLKDEPHLQHSLSLSSSSSSCSSITTSSALSSALRRADSFEMLPCVQPSSVCAPGARDASPMWSWTFKHEALEADDTDAEDGGGGGCGVVVAAQLFDAENKQRNKCGAVNSSDQQHKIALR